MEAVDYDEGLHAGYVQGAALRPEALATWLSVFGRWFPPERPLRLADVGSGAGRFTSALADGFGGPVVGIEPSAKMRSLALATSPHPKVRYLGGCCEALPLGPGTVDGALLFGVWHHLRDRSAGANELARVVRSNGQLLLRTSASDRLAPPWWDHWFPEVHALDLALLPSLAETMATMESAGWELKAIDEVAVPSGLTRRQDLERLQHRALSTLAHLDDAVVEAGLHRIKSALAEDPRADDQLPATIHDLLVLNRS